MGITPSDHDALALATRTGLVVVAGVLLLLLAWPSVSVQQSRSESVEARALKQDATYAAGAIRRRQHAEGYWLTVATPRPVFEDPKTPHVSVFIPALMVDLLEPVAAETGLTDVLTQARVFLGAQIEETGLVRYFGRRGRPGQPDVPAPAGCETPPDSDDTALVWRIAPPADASRVHAVLRALARHRTGSGLYDTWLADPVRYRCFHAKYAGQDVNPVDAGTLVHLYLFLVRYDPEAARSLCGPLQRRVVDDRIWVWYAAAPLIPLFREAELARSGCPFHVPESRLRAAPRGQAPYITLTEGLRALALDPRQSPSAQLFETLGRLAEGNFAHVRTDPPLLANNDPSVPPSESGFHWSEDVVYAFWLRAYVEAVRRTPALAAVPVPALATERAGESVPRRSAPGENPVVASRRGNERRSR
jgi:hypothetical protein